MPKITISYRREDSAVIVGRVFDRLFAHYGPETVFRDIDNIPPGTDFRKYINSTILSTDILLAVVGPNWVGRTRDGGTRITEVNDPVRIEIETALQNNIPVIPVLVTNATMPLPNELPDGLQDFPYRHAIKLDALEDFDDHVRRLIRSLDRLLQSASERTEAERKGREEGEERQARSLRETFHLRAESNGRVHGLVEAEANPKAQTGQKRAEDEHLVEETKKRITHDAFILRGLFVLGSIVVLFVLFIIFIVVMRGY